MERAAEFEAYRPLLRAVAYRMLGSMADAEDIVQDAFLRWQQAAPAQGQMDSPKAFLLAIVTRLCIDQLRSARLPREHYAGPWLPEPLVTSESDDPAGAAELHDAVSVGLLLVLERLSPTERAVFLLREVFQYDYVEVSRIVGKREAHCRQLARRARDRVAERRSRFAASPQQHARLVRQFAHTCSQGDLAGLLALLAEDVTLWSDGGGKVAAARRAVQGRVRVARFFLGLLRKVPTTLVVRGASVNGRTGVVAYVVGLPQAVLTADIVEGRIGALSLVVNPDKLRGVPPLDDRARSVTR